MAAKKFIVAGAGFRGFCDALELAKIPGAEVTIIEPAPFFGGVMYSMDVKGFAVDKGVHVFDSIPKDLAAIVDEIMEGRTCEIDFISESAFNGKVTEGFSLPDLNSLDDGAVKERIRSELLEMAKQGGGKPDPRTLHELFESRYGRTAGGIFSKIFKKVYGIESTEAEPQAIAQTSMGRLKFLDDEQMVELKRSNAFLDSVLAARRKSMGKVDDFVSIYPDDGKAMKGWCDRAVPWLEKKGIRVRLGEKITKIEDTTSGVTVTTDKAKFDVDQVIWSNDNVAALGGALGLDASYVNQHQYGTPMLFITMMTQMEKIKNFTYLQNFDPDAVTYRTASAGRFSKQTRDGISFITSECPAKVGSDWWNKAEANPRGVAEDAWNEVKRLGIVAKNAELVDSHVLRIPTSFKLAKLQYSEKIEQFNQDVARRTKKVMLRNVVPFFRRDIYLDSLKLRDLVR